MPKDYRKRRKSRPAKSNTNNFTWVIFGILIGLFLAIVFYWHQKAPAGSESHSVSTHKTAATSHAEQQPSPAAKKSAVSTTPEFDFYTVLPKMQVTPTTDHPAQTTSAPVHPPIVPSSVPTTSVPTSATTSTTTTSTTTTTTSKAPPATPTAEPDLAAIPETPRPPQSTTPLNKETSPATPPVTLAPTPTPTSLPSPPPPEKKPEIKDTEPANYLLQIAALKNYADADRFKAQLTMLGFDVHIQSYSVNGQIYNRVVMGPYSSKTAATQQQARLQKNHVPSILIKAP